MRFTVDPDVRGAHTLDKAFYLDPAMYELARERIFARSWLWLGDLADVAEPGSLSPRTLMPGLLDEPLLLARDDAGVLRCLSNVCTHRGNVLVGQACRSADIRCRYHGRRFTLEGQLRGMPGFEGVRNFPSPSDDLPQVPFGSFGGHGFASLDPALALADLLAEMQQRLHWLPVDQFTPDPSRSRDYEFGAHWALYVENYLEGLHIPFVHPGLSQAIDMDDYRYELGRASVLQLALAKPGEAAFDLPADSPEHGQRIAAYYWWLFPNLMLNFYPWGLSVNLVQPLGPAHTRVAFRSYVHDAALLSQGAGGALDPVEMEDEAVVMGVQRGIRSRFYRQGRYAPRHEAGVHHFHQLIAAGMNG